MEAFSLLKYWRSRDGAPGAAAATTVADTWVATKTTAADAYCSPYSSDGEDGPFFDLEFALPDEKSPEKSPGNYDEAEFEPGELKFALPSNECTDQSTAALYPSDELFFNGDLVSTESLSVLLNGFSEENSKLPVFLVKSATKFRVLLLKLKKSKSINGEIHLEKPEKDENNQCKFMVVKFKIDGGPLASLFTRDNSSKENGHGVEGLKFSGHLSFPGGGGGGSKGCAAAAAPPCAVVAASGNAKANNNLQAGLKMVRKYLGKSRSTSAAASPPKAASEVGNYLQVKLEFT